MPPWSTRKHLDRNAAQTRKTKRAMLKAWVQAVLVFVGIALVSTLFRSSGSAGTAGHAALDSSRKLAEPKASTGPRTLVSYSYFEKDPGQLANFEFFKAVGMGHQSTIKAPAETDFIVVVSGDVCTPCSSLYPLVKEDPDAKKMPQLASGSSRPGLAMLQRGVNEGMDFAAHNVSPLLNLHHICCSPLLCTALVSFSAEPRSN